jgi:hypothetical protein
MQHFFVFTALKFGFSFTSLDNFITIGKNSKLFFLRNLTSKNPYFSDELMSLRIILQARFPTFPKFSYLCRKESIMAGTDKNHTEVRGSRQPRLTIRVGRGSLSFAYPGAGGLTYEPYSVNGGISMAANLREALRTSALVAQLKEGENPLQRAQVMTDAEAMLVPVEEFRAEVVETLFHRTFTGHKGEQVMWTVLPSLNAVVVFAVNKDLRLVVDDNFADVKWNHVCAPVWAHLHRRSFTGSRRKLYAFVHDKRMELFAFQQNRFRFANSYDANHVADMVYFILNVWKQIGLDAQHDELHLSGELPEGGTLQEEVHQYLRNVYTVNPNAEFNRAEVTRVAGLPYDLMTLFAGVRG